MSNLTINIVNTPNYGKELKDNEELLHQLSIFLQTDIEVNILVNGSSVMPDYIPGGAGVCFSGERVPLGKARFILHKACETKYYIQIDEDDSFENIEDVIILSQRVRGLCTPTGFFRTCIEQQGDKILVPNQYSHQLLLREIKTDVIAGEDVIVSAGLVYNKELLEELPRPFINFAEDDLFWMYLCKYHPETTYIPLEIYKYNREESVMSADRSSVTNLDHGFDHILPFFRLKVVEVLK